MCTTAAVVGACDRVDADEVLQNNDYGYHRPSIPLLIVRVCLCRRVLRFGKSPALYRQIVSTQPKGVFQSLDFLAQYVAETTRSNARYTYTLRYCL